MKDNLKGLLFYLGCWLTITIAIAAWKVTTHEGGVFRRDLVESVAFGAVAAFFPLAIRGSILKERDKKNVK